MVSCGILGEPWNFRVSLGGALELRWRDKNQGHWYGFRTGANIVGGSAVGFWGMKADGSDCHPDDPALVAIHWHVTTKDDHIWCAWIDFRDWNAGLHWMDMTLANDSGNWLHVPEKAGKGARGSKAAGSDPEHWVDLANLKLPDGSPLPPPALAKKAA